MTRDQRRAGRAIRKARRQAAQLTTRQRDELSTALQRLGAMTREQLGLLFDAVTYVAEQIASSMRAMMEWGRALFTLWPPRPAPRPLLHNGRKPR